MKEPLIEGQYRTIVTPIEYELKIKRSRFIATVQNVSNKIDFESALKKIKEKYPRADHYCWAYRYAANPVLEHGSDSGEPAGSAGRSILGSLKKNELLNIMAVVTRYYGGIKLGISGLIYAYGEVTSKAILNAEIIINEPIITFEYECSYEIYHLLINILLRYKITAKNFKTNFNERISGEFNIPLKDISMITKILEEIKYRGYLTYRRKYT